MEKEAKKQHKQTQEKEMPCKLVIEDDKSTDFKVCPVCGYSNKATDGICKMCSNYLF